MKAIDLKYIHVPAKHGPDAYAPGEDAFNVAMGIITRLEAGEKLYFRFNTGEREGSIAVLKKLDMKRTHINREQRRTHFDGPQVDYTLFMKGKVGWGDRKNTAQVDFYSHNGQMTFLDGYEGETVWVKADVKAEAAAIKAETKVLDMRGKEIKEDDIVVFINSRYGSGSCLDYGIVEEIKVKVTHVTHNGMKDVEVTTIIRNIRSDHNGKDIVSKIKNPENYILVVTDTDLAADAVASKLEE